MFSYFATRSQVCCFGELSLEMASVASMSIIRVSSNSQVLTAEAYLKRQFLCLNYCDLCSILRTIATYFKH